MKITDYLMKNGIKTVAIYDIGEVGQLLYEELKGEQVQVSYLIESVGGNAIEGDMGKSRRYKGNSLSRKCRCNNSYTGI